MILSSVSHAVWNEEELHISGLIVDLSSSAAAAAGNRPKSAHSGRLASEMALGINIASVITSAGGLFYFSFDESSAASHETTLLPVMHLQQYLRLPERSLVKPLIDSLLMHRDKQENVSLCSLVSSSFASNEPPSLRSARRLLELVHFCEALLMVAIPLWGKSSKQSAIQTPTRLVDDGVLNKMLAVVSQPGTCTTILLARAHSILLQSSPAWSGRRELKSDPLSLRLLLHRLSSSGGMKASYARLCQSRGLLDSAYDGSSQIQCLLTSQGNIIWT